MALGWMYTVRVVIVQSQPRVYMCQFEGLARFTYDDDEGEEQNTALTSSHAPCSGGIGCGGGDGSQRLGREQAN